MADPIERLMETSLMHVFNERDTHRRLAAIEHIYAPDVEWTDDEGVTVGQDQLNAKTHALQNGPLAGLSFAKAGPVHQTRGLGYLAWNVVAPGSDQPIASGFDVALVTDGRIRQLFTVLTETFG